MPTPADATRDPLPLDERGDAVLLRLFVDAINYGRALQVAHPSMDVLGLDEAHDVADAALHAATKMWRAYASIANERIEEALGGERAGDPSRVFMDDESTPNDARQ
jgi:hypothetical protein